MTSNDDKDLNKASAGKNRRRSDRYKTSTRTRSELYKDRHLIKEEIREETINIKQEQPLQKAPKENVIRKQEAIEQQIFIPKGKKPIVENDHREEAYLYDLLNKQDKEAEKQEISKDKPQKDDKEIEKKETAKERPEEEKRPLYLFLIKLGVFALFMIIMFVFVFGIHINKGDRMYPFIMDGDVLITLKITSYQAGDVVVYQSPETGKKEVSRIAAKGPGEVDVFYGSFIVNSETEETGLYETYQLEDSPVEFPYEVSADGYFLLDDYRHYGKDSRLFGQLNKKDLKGKVVYVFRVRGI